MDGKIYAISGELMLVKPDETYRGQVWQIRAEFL